MTKLNLLALKAQQQKKEQVDASANPDQVQGVQLPDSKVEDVPVSEESASSEQGTSLPAPQDTVANDSPTPKATGLAFLKAAAQHVEVATPTDAAPAAAKPALGFLAAKRIGAAKNNDAPAQAASPPTVPATQVETPAKEKTNLELLVESTAADGTLGKTSRFADEIPADAPIRDLPPELETQAKSFVGSLDSVYKALHEPELLGSVIRGIMIELSNHPEYRKLISPMDYHTMVKGMRESMGLARIKKEESKAKRTPSKKSTVITDLDALNALEGMDFS